VREHCSTLSECFQGKSASDDVLKRVARSGQYLASFLKHEPQLVEEPLILQSLELFASACPTEAPFLHEHFSKVLRLCLKSLPSDPLLHLWSSSTDIQFCCYVVEIASIPIDAYFRKLSIWVENPQADVVFYRAFISILKAPTVDVVETDLLLSFAICLADPKSPVRASLAFLVLNSFTAVNAKLALCIVAAWLYHPIHRPHGAEFARQLLARAGRSELNMIATLVLEFPTLLAVLPPTTDGFASLAALTLHRVALFAPDGLTRFLELCDRTVRGLAKRDAPVAPDVRLIDGGGPELAPMFDREPSTDSLAAVVMFARTAACADCRFLPPETRRKIAAGLANPVELPVIQPEEPDVDPGAVKRLYELIEATKVPEMSKLVPSPVV
jgi:hypothetical protein